MRSVALGFASTGSVKMLSKSSLHDLAEQLRNLKPRKTDPFDMIFPGDVEDILGFAVDDEYWYTADSVYRFADLIDPYSNQPGEADE